MRKRTGNRAATKTAARDQNLRRSRVLEKLRAGQTAVSMKFSLSDPRAIELAGTCGMDAAWLCNEHVPNDWVNLENQVRAARVHDMDTIVRVSKGSYSDYVKPFEADATGIMVPHVVTGDEARQIVKWTRFKPIGRRPLDGGNTDGKFCQIPLDEYLSHSNRERFIIMQIESPEALENVEEIAAVEGYEFLLFGPGDFSHLIGKPGQVNDPEVVRARQRVGAAARKNGKFAMSPGLLAPRDVLESEGYRLINVCSDVLGLADYVKAKLEAFSTAKTFKPKGRRIYG